MTLPPGPQSHAFLQSLNFLVNPLGYLDSCAQTYPDIFTAPVGITGFQQTVYVSHPSAIQKLLANENRSFDAPGWVNRILLPLVGENSILMLDGDSHRSMRQLLIPAFHGEYLHSYGSVICNIARDVFGLWEQDKVHLAFSAMQEITLRVILQEVFGIHEGIRYETIKRLIGSAMERLNSPWGAALLFIPGLQKNLGSWSPWGQLLQEQKKIDDLLYDEIRQRRTNYVGHHRDILSLMMSARGDKGEAMTDVELHDEIISLLIGGHDTTATAMTWALYWIHSMPEVYQKVYQEIQSLGTNPDPIEIYRLPYLTAVCAEVLRIYPMTIHTLPRVTRQPIELMGYELDVGTLVVGTIYLTHHRQDLYPNPKQFLPDRFLNHQFSPYEYLPFGGGARRCIGAELAQFEMKLVIATLLSGWEIKLVDSQPVKPIRRWVTLGPSNGVKIVAIKR